MRSNVRHRMSWIDKEMPYRGRCGFCGDDDARHRDLETIRERIAAGDSRKDVAADYGVSVKFVKRLVRQRG